MDKLTKKYCCGCGLCNNFLEGEVNDKGYFRPNEKISEFDFSKCYCNYLNKIDKDNFWGNILSMYYGYSNDQEIRKKASSGGTLTEIACYLINNNIVDCIVQIKRAENQISTDVVYNFSEKDIKQCIGSRYTASSSLKNLLKKINIEKKYAVIGKPCDIRVLREYIKENNLENTIIYLLTFFCARNSFSKSK